VTLSPNVELAVRPPANEEETAAFFRLAAAQFIRDSPGAIAAADFRRFVYDAPGADPRSVRGAFRDDDYLGGYLVEERELRVGSARLRAGCIGVVVVDPAQRGHGVGKALMQDAFAHARARGQVLLLLHGLADFYRPFGYADVFDATEHVMQLAEILALPASPYRVRAATSADAPALLALYDRHYGPHPGSFARTLEQEQFLLRFSASLDPHSYPQRDGLPFEVPVVAVDERSRVRGSLVVPWGPLRAFGSEVAADDWPAALALLQHQARQYDALTTSPAELRWPLPPDSLAAELLADHLSIERRVKSRPWANWEAALVDPARLLRDMVPGWRERWRQHNIGWCGDLAMTVDHTRAILCCTADDLTLATECDEAPLAVALSGTVVLPLLFGFRSVAWAAVQSGQRIPAEALPILETLFPPLTPWIAPTDGC
jgi:predicted N-acetyltransferase YhbS